MVSIHVAYDGGKSCTLTHDDSGAVIRTTAPKDVGGEGNAFSPTDLVASALAACIITTMAMFAERNGLELTGSKVHVTKEMSTDAPRRIVGLPVTVTLPANNVPADIREKLEIVGHTCPVAKSLAAGVNAPITFVYE
ncbi:MAG TPA: OsmC family protein [Capsulimonadaceae bacterium]|jgi:uncharacterized OsmC-like protein